MTLASRGDVLVVTTTVVQNNNAAVTPTTVEVLVANGVVRYNIAWLCAPLFGHRDCTSWN
jgi:hypothetical protein